MGSCLSGNRLRGNKSRLSRKQVEPLKLVATKYYTLEQHKEYERLGLNRHDVKRYCEAFIRFQPNDKDHMVVIRELLDQLDLVGSALTDAIFNVVGDVSKHRLSFHEFLIFTWPFLCLGNIEVKYMSFKLLNKSGTGILTSRELRRSAKDIHGNHYHEAEEQVENFCEIIDGSELGSITDIQYMRNVDNYPIILMPFFTVRNTMREFILGERFWLLREVQSVRVKKGAEYTQLYDTVRMGFSSRHSALHVELEKDDEDSADKKYEELMTRYECASGGQRSPGKKSRSSSNDFVDSPPNSHQRVSYQQQLQQQRDRRNSDSTSKRRGRNYSPHHSHNMHPYSHNSNNTPTPGAMTPASYLESDKVNPTTIAQSMARLHSGLNEQLKNPSSPTAGLSEEC